MISLKHFAWILLTCLGAMSCDNPSWLVEKQFAADGWSLQDTLQFSYDNSSAEPKSLQIQLQMDPEYGYRNIWLKLWVEGPGGEPSSIMIGDTLMDEAGNWNTEFSGSNVQHLIQPSSIIEFEEIGTYQLKLLQFMREENLKGMVSLKLAIED